jgi:TolB-like protein/Flp pilus assembly protein TadD
LTDHDTTNGNPVLRPTTVFFSYSREDQARAVPIIELIQQSGFATWWDGLLEGGERFSRATEDALDRANAVIVLWSKTAVQSHWVRDEATRGRDRGVIVPLSLDGSEPPLGFGQFQVINLEKAKISQADPQIQRVLHAIAALHDNPAPILVVKPGRNPFVSRRMAIGGGVALATSAGGLALWKGGVLGGNVMVNSGAVLPFTNLSGDPAQSYFSDGLASEIRAQLSRNALIETAGQTSSSQFRDFDGNVRSIAGKLGVAFLLNGNVQKMGDRLKIVTFLIDGKTGKNVWSEIFERQLADIFLVQSEIAAAVTRKLAFSIDARKSGEKVVPIGGTKSLAAFDVYLRGRDQFEAHVDEESERAALAKLEQAIEIDPEYAAARALRSRALSVIANQYVTSDERKSLYREAVVDAKRATQIAPGFSPGFAALGYALFYGQLDAQAARVPYQRANALARSDVDVLSRFAVYCARTGRFSDAEIAIGKASALDPLNPSMFKSAGNIKYAAKDYEGAIELGRKALALNPKRSTLHGDIGNAYLMMGEMDKALDEFGQETNTLLALPGSAVIAHKRGDRAAARKSLAALVEEHGDNGLYQQAQIFAQWGEPDTAFKALEKAYESADSGLVYLLNDPFLEPVRNDARYKKLLIAMKFV